MSNKLFEPIQLGDIRVRNRVWVPPMCQYSVENGDGVATDWHLVHYGSFAKGGAGAIIVEATAVVPEGRISAKDLGLWNDSQRDALKPTVDFIRSQGAVAGIQLAHAGRKANVWPEWGTASKEGSVPLHQGGWETVAPSAAAFPGLATPRELSQLGIDGIVSAFVSAARRAVDAGFELIEIHGAHGYLIHEFLSPLSNLRTDFYGGTLVNRARLLLDIVDKVRAEVGSDIALVVRLSATDWVTDGLQLADTVQIATWLKQHGVQLLDISSGGNVLAEIPAGPGYQTPFAAKVREEAAIATGAVGLISDPIQAEHILVTEQADVVLVGREMLRDPHFALRAAAALSSSSAPIPEPYLRAF